MKLRLVNIEMENSTIQKLNGYDMRNNKKYICKNTIIKFKYMKNTKYVYINLMRHIINNTIKKIR